MMQSRTEPKIKFRNLKAATDNSSALLSNNHEKKTLLLESYFCDKVVLLIDF